MKLFPKIVGGVLVLVFPSIVLGGGVLPLDSAPAGTVPTGVGLGGGLYRIINGLLVIVAAIAVIIMVLGGVRYILSQGEEDQVEQAKRTILYAGIGLLVIGLAAVIVNFVINSYQNPNNS
jgi:hypothetical protein